MSMNPDDFRKILATPRTTSGSKAPPLFTPSRTSKLNPFKKPPPRIRREGRSDVLEHSHVDLGSGFIDRAKERRLAELKGENEQSGEVKGLDFELLKKVRSGEFVLPKFEPPKPQRDDSDDSDEEKEVDDMDEDAILDELLQMEMELQLEQERAEKESDEKEKLATVAEEPVVKDTGEEGALPEAPVVEQQSRFKPIVDAKQMKQLRRERKRRKLAMEAMDRLSKPMTPPPVPKKSRAELLEQLRQIQAAKKLQMSKTAEAESTPKEPVIEKEFISPLVRSTTKTNLPTRIPPESKEQREFTPVENIPPDSELPLPVDEPPRQRSPPVKVGDNMFSDDSELSDYNPYTDDSDEEPPPITTKSKESTVKRNYFDDKSKDAEPSPSGPITLDPTIAAALRKAASLADKRGIPEQVKEEETTKNRMSLGGADGVYEFDEDDTWDGEEDDEISSRKRKRKEKKT
jgi:hypothetical protein